MKHGLAYVTSLIVFLAIDMAWLGTMAQRFYRPILGDILSPTVNVAPAIAFYLIFPLGLTVFALAPALRDNTGSTALIYGALFGFFTYATYDLTNHATVRNWTAQLTVIDITWGTVLSAATAIVSYWITQKFS